MTYLNEAQSNLLPARVLRFSLQVWQGYRQWLHTGPYAGGMPGAFCCLLSCIVLSTQQNVFNTSELSLDPSAGQSWRVVCPYYLIQNSAMGLCCRLNSGWNFLTCLWSPWSWPQRSLLLPVFLPFSAALSPKDQHTFPVLSVAVSSRHSYHTNKWVISKLVISDVQRQLLCEV